jgi:VWFA-related protein
MRTLIILGLLAGIVPGAFAAKRITVDQLEQVLKADHGKHDEDEARQIYGLELTERLSAAQLSQWEQNLPGTMSRQALRLLADQSQFLDPPVAEIPQKPTPDFAEQRRMMALTVDYLTKTMRQLPNFMATREMVRYEDTPQGYRADRTLVPYQPLHSVDRPSSEVVYRDGREVENVAARETTSAGMNTAGEFGPILNTVMLDAAASKLAWGHWEQGANGPEAVFRYAVPQKSSHYEVTFCCVAGAGGSYPFQQKVGYRGEIAVDPETGAILRVSLIADLKPDAAIQSADVLVEYGPVALGGRTYLCPVRSIALSVVPADAFRPALRGSIGSLMESPAIASSQLTGASDNGEPGELVTATDPGSLRTFLNETTFDSYHLFRAEVHLVEDTSAIASGAGEGSGNRGQADSTGAAAQGEAAARTTSGNTPPAVAAEVPPSAAVKATEPAAKSSETAKETSPAETNLPEISVASAEPNLNQPQSSDSVLHASARLVDIDVVAYDRKGHPIADLDPQEFEVSDNGRQQKVKFVTSPLAEQTAEESAPAASATVFSNREGVSRSGHGSQGDDLTVLLIDGGNLAWADLANARPQIEEFLKKLPPGEHAAIYALTSSGFQVVQSETTDRARLADAFAHWMPTAADLARAQAEEQRNDQSMDYVQHQTDLQYVNGNAISAPETVMSVDPQLKQNGSNAGRDAMAALSLLARHLAGIPGHKNLVWITSDNVLADWSDRAVSVDKGNGHIAGLVLQTQEVMNDAHVTFYPLDASHLESATVTADIQTRNVELQPGAVYQGMGQNAPMAGQPAAEGVETAFGPRPGRTIAEIQQDEHGIQGPIREMAEATGGRAIRRAGDMVATLNGVAEDGRATYTLGFSPDTPPDGQYHLLTVKLANRPGVTLRYRTGYLYNREPATIKERFQQAVWSPTDMRDIDLSVSPVVVADGVELQLKIGGSDLALQREGDRWVDKLDVFVIRRGADRAEVSGKTLALALKPDTYARIKDGEVPFKERILLGGAAATTRIVVVDRNSGLIGTVTIPAGVPE